jgi:hypothetical protein
MFDMCLFCACAVMCLRRADHSSKKPYRLGIDQETEKRPGPTRDIEPLKKKLESFTINKTRRGFMLVSFSALKMEAKRSAQRSVDSRRTTRHYSPVKQNSSLPTAVRTSNPTQLKDTNKRNSV